MSGTAVAAATGRARARIAEVARHFAEGRIRTAVYAGLTPADCVEAQRILEDRADLGRVLLYPRPHPYQTGAAPRARIEACDM